MRQLFVADELAAHLIPQSLHFTGLNLDFYEMLIRQLLQNKLDKIFLSKCYGQQGKYKK